ncbi:hypothetical protein CTAYLR_003903 [Chrysophaeum taylorii]|uniref:Aminotransferase class I/classII large domain-containing protein n=1 Tax=Chrysophaeum taylorii TaxID=2483200 RepID=A0AAD7UA87_9STRA|nr:hypothetical protein CTAYLR_003903 [Chrysophaeum taylorii]
MAALLRSRFVGGSILKVADLNPLVLKAEYAVRGQILQRAMEIEADIKAGNAKWPFDRVVRCNIGNPQALGQTPPKFARQVLSMIMNPELLATGVSSYSTEVLERARTYATAIKGGVGAYSDSKGVRIVRDEVAAFIEQRDGYPSDPEAIYLTDGASAGVRHLTQLLLRGPQDAILAPSPQYPLYSALATLGNGSIAPYYLDEEADWSVAVDELERAYAAAAKAGNIPRGLVIINPGNPTGASLTREALDGIVHFCQRRDLVLLADEVYQENVYGTAPPFVSLKKVMRDLRADDVPLVSFHSISKGFTGECGLRGGYFELANFRTDVRAQLTKLASISLCSNVVGQIGVGLMVNPPTSPEEKSAYEADRDAKLDSLERRAELVADALNALPGVSCARAQGALYLFPNIEVPPKAVDAAAAAGLQPDAFYSLRMLESTGLVVVPGSGFGQKNGTWHFRTTFLPSPDDIESVVARLAGFHRGFLEEFADPAEPAHPSPSSDL